MTDVANQSVRFGVAVRLLSAFAAITIFAIATSIIALYTFGKYGDGFNRIASSNMPALVAASNLAQRSQALAANAPNLAVAPGAISLRQRFFRRQQQNEAKDYPVTYQTPAHSTAPNRMTIAQILRSHH